MQHRIDLSTVQAPATAVEYARRLAQRGTPLTTLLRTYRLGHARFTDWLFKELARHADDGQVISAGTLSMSRIVAAYIDQVKDASGTADELTRLERAVGQVAVQAACAGDPVFLARDEPSAWAWLPLGIRDRFDSAEASTANVSADVHFAFGDPARGPSGFCLTYLQAIAAESVALAARLRAPRVLTFTEVAPVAMMLGSPDLLRGWVRGRLAGLAADDEHHARLRETLLVFLQSGGLQSHGRAPRAAQEHSPVPDPQGRGEHGPRRGRQPPRRGARAAGELLARRGSSACWPRAGCRGRAAREGGAVTVAAMSGSVSGWRAQRVSLQKPRSDHF
jgi:hypothetical protein